MVFMKIQCRLLCFVVISVYTLANKNAFYPFVMLEHLNINSGGLWNTEFEQFYTLGLGFVKDIRSEKVLNRTQQAGGMMQTLEWRNIGLQQIHFPSDEPQRIDGYISLEYSNINLLKTRLLSYDISFQSMLHENTENNEEYIQVKCPIGNIYRIYQQLPYNLSINPIINTNASISTPPSSNVLQYTYLGPNKYIHPSSNYIQSDSDMSVGLGLSTLTFYCPLYTAIKICQFYTYFFNTSTTSITIDNEYNTTKCSIAIGYRQYIQYIEHSHDPDSPDPESTVITSGYHIAIYIEDFLLLYEQLYKYNLIWNNPRFPDLTYNSKVEVLRHWEFRFKNIIDVYTGELLFELEHEIR